MDGFYQIVVILMNGLYGVVLTCGRLRGDSLMHWGLPLVQPEGSALRTAGSAHNQSRNQSTGITQHLHIRLTNQI